MLCEYILKEKIDFFFLFFYFLFYSFPVCMPHISCLTNYRTGFSWFINCVVLKHRNHLKLFCRLTLLQRPATSNHIADFVVKCVASSILPSWLLVLKYFALALLYNEMYSIFIFCSHRLHTFFNIPLLVPGTVSLLNRGKKKRPLTHKKI